MNAIPVALAVAAGGLLAWAARGRPAGSGGLWGLLNEGADSSPFLPHPGAQPAPPAGESPFDFLVDMTTPRGIRNNNPGNVKMGASPWLGKVPASRNTDGTFEQFTDAKYGLRVIAYLLLRYQRDKAKRTLRQLIEERGGWAAPSNTDRNPATYGDFVARAMGIRETDYIDLSAGSTLAGVVRAIVQFENGRQPYPDAVIAWACDSARESVL